MVALVGLDGNTGVACEDAVIRKYEHETPVKSRKLKSRNALLLHVQL